MSWASISLRGAASCRRFDQAYSAADRGPPAAAVVGIDDGHRLGRIWPHAALVNNDAGRDHYPNVFKPRAARRAGRSREAEWSAHRIRAAPSRAPTPRPRRTCLKTMYQHLGVNTAVQYADGLTQAAPRRVRRAA